MTISWLILLRVGLMEFHFHCYCYDSFWLFMITMLAHNLLSQRSFIVVGVYRLIRKANNPKLETNLPCMQITSQCTHSFFANNYGMPDPGSLLWTSPSHVPNLLSRDAHFVEPNVAVGVSSSNALKALVQLLFIYCQSKVTKRKYISSFLWQSMHQYMINDAYCPYPLLTVLLGLKVSNRRVVMVFKVAANSRVL